MNLAQFANFLHFVFLCMPPPFLVPSSMRMTQNSDPFSLTCVQTFKRPTIFVVQMSQYELTQYLGFVFNILSLMLSKIQYVLHFHFTLLVYFSHKISLIFLDLLREKSKRFKKKSTSNVVQQYTVISFAQKRSRTNSSKLKKNGLVSIPFSPEKNSEILQLYGSFLRKKRFFLDEIIQRNSSKIFPNFWNTQLH